MAATPADGIDFVDENQARRVLASLLKHVPNAACADADEHFHEIRTADAKESSVCFARNCFSQQRFTRAGRANHQDAFGNPAAKALELFGIFEELDQFGNFLDGLVDAG